jgi:D-alanyl-D-alanine carboxypeptidase (penicillin-binding protein 5/6)
MKRAILKTLFFFFITICLPVYGHASGLDTSAKQAVIIDMGTGMTLLSKNADQKMPTSSMSKVMTAYVVFDSLKQGRIKMDTMFPVSQKAWEKGGSKMFIEVGKKVSIEDLLKGLIVQSGNDAAIALAEGLAGDEDQFALALNARAQELGMKNSHFKNASGWPDPEHYSTANDLALLAQRLIVDFPHEYSIYSMKEFTYAGIRQPNRNPLLYRNMGVDGIKTGHTEAGGYGLIASGERDERRVVMVVNGLDSETDRANESARLMSWALNNFENITLFKANDIIDTAPTVFATQDRLPLTIGRDVRVTVPKGQRANIQAIAEYKSPLKAPLHKGDKVGVLKITIPQVGEFNVPLLAAEDLEETGFIGRAIENLGLMLSKK